MSPRREGRTQTCGRAQAQTRLAQARKFLEVAEVVASEKEIPESASCSAALAVLAGIAASDAACCGALGRRSRGQDHHNAEELLEQIEPGGSDAASTLQRVLAIKDTAHYGLIHVTPRKLRAVLRQAEKLVEFAADVLSR